MLAAIVLWLVLPIVPLALWSVARSWTFPDILPRVWSLQAWAYVSSEASGVLDSLWLSIWVSAAATGLSLLLGVPAGRAIGLLSFPGKPVVALLVLAPVIVPGIAVAMGLHGVFIRLGLASTWLGVVLVHLVPTLPYVILVTAGVFANFDRDFEAQARCLGASRLATLRHVTLPMVLPGVLVAGLFAFLVSWSQYALTLVIGGGRVVTLPLLLTSFAASGRHDVTGALAMVYMLPGFVALVATARMLSGRNVALGGVPKA